MDRRILASKLPVTELRATTGTREPPRLRPVTAWVFPDQPSSPSTLSVYLECQGIRLTAS